MTKLSDQWRKEAAERPGLHGYSPQGSRADALCDCADALDTRKAELVKAIMSLPTHSNIGFDMQRRAAKIVEEL